MLVAVHQFQQNELDHLGQLLTMILKMNDNS